ncbi:C39 family peptidase [Actinomadura fulvescens]|uniref:Peptidase C39-like domain-containing protein n=1 Tax=Actinomadura fulvescens TaxID=46160 RepID=A0ABN3PD46_9ACTN
MKRSTATTIIAALAAAPLAVPLPANAAAPAPAAPPAAEATGGTGGKPPPKERILKNVTWERQKHLWYCGPAAARIALTTWVRKPKSQDKLAKDMVSGPPWNRQTPNVLFATIAMNKALAGSGKGRPYRSRFLHGGRPFDYRRAKFLADIKRTVGTRGRAMVINIRSTKSRQMIRAYPNRDVYHYVVVYGYSSNNRIYIADPASGLKDYKGVPKKYSVTISHLTRLLHAGDKKHPYQYLD